MLNPANLFRLLNELVFVLLGVLLVWVAVARRFFFSRPGPAWIGLGAFLIYWGLRAWSRGARRPSRCEAAAAAARGASFALLGAIMLGMVWAPTRWTAPLLGSAGTVLMLRGLVGAVLAARFS